MHNNKTVVIEFQTHIAKRLQGNKVDIAPYFTDDAQWHLPSSLDDFIHGAHRCGKEAVINLIETAVQTCYKPHTMHFDFHSMISDRDFVHQHFTLSAETANGKPYTSGYQTLFKLREGKISEVWEYFDSGLLLSLFSNCTEKP